MNENISNVLALGTLLADIFIVILLTYWFIRRKKSSNDKLMLFFKTNGLRLAFGVVLMATLGSLYFSEIALYAPCKLCWIQRIFMFPQVLILGIALWQEDYGIRKYSICLAIIGAGFGVYQYLTQLIPDLANIGCKAEQGDCSFKYSFNYGYITIVMMSITAFLLVILFMSLWKRKELFSNE